MNPLVRFLMLHLPGGVIASSVSNLDVTCNKLYGFNFMYLKENDSKRARALKKAAEEREMRRAKDREIARYERYTVNNSFVIINAHAHF
jgi:hypothetical protein